MANGKNNLLIFVGAGASVSLGYPTTVRFNEELPRKIKDNPVYVSLLSLFTTLPANDPEGKKILEDVGIPPIDIERILWKLKEIKHPLILAQNNNDFWKYFHSTKVKMSESLKQIQSLESDIQKQVYESYSSTELQRKKMMDTNYWLDHSFLERMKQGGCNIEIFTTNYDRAIEKSIEDYGADYKKPFQEGAFSNGLKIDEWDTNKAFTRSIWLTKLHGSINWKYYDRQQIVESSETYLENNPILYPGFKDKPEGTPFKEFHDYFASSLKECNSLLAIGFSFRDEYINKLIAENFPKENYVFILDPQSIQVQKEKVWEKHQDLFPISDEANNASINRVASQILSYSYMK